MTTIIPRSTESAHWYTATGEPRHFMEKKDGSGLRPTTLRDARKHGWLPSPTSILRVLHKQGLEDWKIAQACLSVLTAPRKPDEALDVFVERVLHTEKQQDAEAQKARDLGTDIHAAIEAMLNGQAIEERLAPFVEPAVYEAQNLGSTFLTEKILVGEGYAGKTDLIAESSTLITVVDFKTCKKLPKESWDEHKLQLSAYAKALGNTGSKPVQTANIYITTTLPVEVAVSVHKDWQETFEQGFKPLLQYWQWVNNYIPNTDVPMP